MIALGKKILIVDDDKFLLNIFISGFKQEGFDVKTAGDGQEAWDIIQGGFLPDIVFTGILMPRMTGFYLVRKMQADPKLASIPVAIFSHRGRPEDKETARELNVDDFLIQGVVPLTEIVRRIELLLEIHQIYHIKVGRNQYDSEALIDLLNKQQQTSLGFEMNKDVYLAFKPGKEAGEFNVSLTENPNGPGT
jgi:CheY-like chemotaxis protein